MRTARVKSIINAGCPTWKKLHAAARRFDAAQVLIAVPSALVFLGVLFVALARGFAPSSLSFTFFYVTGTLIAVAAASMYQQFLLRFRREIESLHKQLWAAQEQVADGTYDPGGNLALDYLRKRFPRYHIWQHASMWFAYPYDITDPQVSIFPGPEELHRALILDAMDPAAPAPRLRWMVDPIPDLTVDGPATEERGRRDL